jgi:hypothetical protein
MMLDLTDDETAGKFPSERRQPDLHHAVGNSTVAGRLIAELYSKNDE